MLKSKGVFILILSGLILMPFLGAESFAQSNQVLSVITEKESYAAGEPVVILGLAEIKLQGTPVMLQIFSPIGNIVAIDQFDVENDGSFSTTVATSIGGAWKEDGTYKVKISYGNNSVQTEFEYGGMISAGVAAPEFSIVEEEDNSQSIKLEDSNVEYELSGAEIVRMFPDTENKSLIIEIKTYSDGELKITLPKTVIDTDEEGFFVLVDGDETNHNAVSVSEYWTLTIPFSYGSEEIEIIGTFVIPEFGTVVALILVISISTIIIISSKNKQIFFQRI
tara:strand:- start:792 stop:1628 length:837 start_codon:yes stop_codon:yes gene_type:complete